jgi:hypothetical protein
VPVGRTSPELAAAVGGGGAGGGVGGGGGEEQAASETRPAANSGPVRRVTMELAETRPRVTGPPALRCVSVEGRQPAASGDSGRYRSLQQTRSVAIIIGLARSQWAHPGVRIF